MKKPLPWGTIKKTVSKTIRSMYKHGSSFVAARDVAGKLYEEKHFKDISYKATIDRVTKVMKDHMKWEIFSNGTKGRVYIVPQRWWDNAKAKTN